MTSVDDIIKNLTPAMREALTGRCKMIGKLEAGEFTMSPIGGDYRTIWGLYRRGITDTSDRFTELGLAVRKRLTEEVKGE